MEKTKKNNKPLIIVLISIISFLVLSIGVLLYVFLLKDDIKQVKKQVELNDKVKLLSLVNNPRNDTIISKDKEVDTTTLGVQKLIVEYKNKFNKKKEYKFSIKIIDTTKPVIECEEVISVPVNTKEINIKATDNSKQDIKPTIEGEYDLTKMGEYKVTVNAKDLSGNKATKKVTIKVTAPNVKLEGFYIAKPEGVWYSIALRDNDYIELETNPCPGMGCGLFQMDGRYKTDGDKLTITLDHQTDDIGEREELKEPSVIELTIKDENTLVNKDFTFNYQDKQW